MFCLTEQFFLHFCVRVLFVENESIEKWNKTIPLRVGALLFRNSADRNMVLKDSIDKVNDNVYL